MQEQQSPRLKKARQAQGDYLAADAKFKSGMVVACYRHSLETFIRTLYRAGES